MANHSLMTGAGVLKYSGANNPGWISNLAIATATTANANDSIKITSADGTDLSTTNPGWITLPGLTAGQLSTFKVTANITILTTGAHWGLDTTGDVTGGLLRVLAINDNATLKWGIAYLGGRHTLLTTDTSAAAAGINRPEYVLCTTAIGSASNTCLEVGYVRANFDDTGGAAENLWANQTGIADIVTGKTADGLPRTWNVTFNAADFSGADPTVAVGIARWTQVGRTITVDTGLLTTEASGSTDLRITSVAFSRTRVFGCNNVAVTNNSVATTTPGLVEIRTDENELRLLIDTLGNQYSAAGNKSGSVAQFTYEVGPTASFID